MTTRLQETPDGHAHSPSAPVERIEFANALRGLAALSVLIGHYLAVFWEAPAAVSGLTGMAAPPTPTPLVAQWVLAFPLNPSAFGVALFFVISGFVIPFSFRSYGRLDFLIGRIFRIYPTYWTGLTVSLAIVAIGNWALNVPFPHSTTEVLYGYFVGARDIAWVKSVDGVVWTLEVELKFYLICALIAPWLRQGSMKAFLVPVALSLGSLFLGLALTTATTTRFFFIALSSPYLLFMFIGVALSYLHRRLLNHAEAAIVVAALLLMFCLALRFGFFRAIGLAPTYAAAVVVFAMAMRLPAAASSIRYIGFLADISYPLYVIHGLVGYTLMVVLLTAHVPGWVCALTAIIFSTSIAWIIHVFVETPSHFFGRSLAKTVRDETTPQVSQPAPE
jgi:peptidoglycan/LPS O-acetylase OafA/YrhL